MGFCVDLKIVCDGERYLCSGFDNEYTKNEKDIVKPEHRYPNKKCKAYRVEGRA